MSNRRYESLHVGPPLISVKHEVVQALIGWLEAGGLPRDRIVIGPRLVVRFALIAQP